MKEYKSLLLEADKPVLKIILNRPAKANAVNKEMISELMDLFTRLRYETEYHFIVITGQGKFFSAGADIPEAIREIERGQMMDDQIRTYQLDGHELMHKIENLEQITICAINGYMVGGGLALAMACDFRIMDAEAKLSIPEAELGLFFTWGSTPRLTKLVGGSKAKELIMLCNEIGAEEALRIGLVDKVTPSGQLHTTVEEMLLKLKKRPFLPIRLTKKIINSIEATANGNIAIFEPELHEHSHLTGIPQECMRTMVNNLLRR